MAQSWWYQSDNTGTGPPTVYWIRVLHIHPWSIQNHKVCPIFMIFGGDIVTTIWDISHWLVLAPPSMKLAILKCLLSKKKKKYVFRTVYRIHQIPWNLVGINSTNVINWTWSGSLKQCNGRQLICLRHKTKPDARVFMVRTQLLWHALKLAWAWLSSFWKLTLVWVTPPNKKSVILGFVHFSHSFYNLFQAPPTEVTGFPWSLTEINFSHL